MLKYTIEQRPELPELQQLANDIADDYFDVVQTGMAAHERSHQRLIGPSELGVPCQRALIHKLAQDEEPPDSNGWKPAVGTALHTQMEEWFTKYRHEFVKVEQRVSVGHIGPDEIKGSTDFFYGNGIVGDHKFCGPTRIKEYKAKGPGPQYRTQAHLYGSGWERLGYLVELVMIFFVPRDGELRDSYVWWEPYDRQVAIDAMANANKLYDLMSMFGKEQALSMFDPCDDRWCPWCKTIATVAEIQASNPFSFTK